MPEAPRPARARGRIQEENRLFRTMTDLTMAGAAVMDLSGHILYMNKAMGGMLGVDPEDAPGCHFNDFHTPEQRREIEEIHERCLREGALAPTVIWHRRAVSGEMFPALTTGSVIHDASGDPMYVFVTAIDITESVQAEQALRESEARARAFIDSPFNMAMLLDPDGTVLDANAIAAAVFRMTPAEIAGRCVFDFFAPDAAAQRRRVFDSVVRTGAPAHYEDRNQSDVLDVRLFPVFGRNGAVAQVAALGLDITDRIRARRKLEESEARARALLNSPFTSAVLLDPDGIVLDLNAVAEARAGRSREELIGKCAFDFLAPDVAAARREKMRQAVETGEVVQYEDRTPERVLEAHLFPLKNQDGAVFQIAAIGHDITGKIRAQEEKESLIEQLYQSQKMEAVGQLAGGIAHDFNNILAVIMGGAEMLLRNTAAGAPGRARIERIIEAGERGRALTMKLLTFARREKLDVQSLHAARLLEDVADMVRMSNPDGIRISVRAAADLPALAADAGQLTQALLNICLNACDAMPGGGDLMLCAEPFEMPAPGRINGQELDAGSYCAIRVSDTGGGIAPGIRERIFEPFFTTKERGKGTGLGLSVALGIAQNHGGAIDISSAPGAGATVSVVLPVGHTRNVAPPPAPQPESAPPARRTLLVVDDAQDFLEMAADTLEMEGFEVITASSGSRAVEIFRSRAHQIHAVLLDMIMQEDMSGAQTFYALRKIAPQARVIICSGFSPEGNASRLLADGAAGFLQKPFRTRELLRCLAAALDGA